MNKIKSYVKKGKHIEKLVLLRRGKIIIYLSGVKKIVFCQNVPLRAPSMLSTVMFAIVSLVSNSAEPRWGSSTQLSNLLYTII